MRETHYIDSDEEIITAVSRLRHAGHSENVFVFPKRALILQSVINLRLLEREAKKLGKSIIVITQDEAGRKLAERAGLKTETTTERVPLEYAPLALRKTSLPDPRAHLQPEASRTAQPIQRASSGDIGSTDFYTEALPSTPLAAGESLQRRVSVAPIIQTAAPAPAVRSLRIRNASPSPLTSLNSLRSDGVIPHTEYMRQAPVSPAAIPVEPPTATPHEKRTVFSQPRTYSGRLGRFMDNGRSEAPSLTITASGVSAKSSSRPKSGAALLRWTVSVLSVMVIGGIAVLGQYIFFPHATITLTPHSAEQVVRIQIAAAVTPGTDKTLSARVVSTEKTFQIKEPATGTTTTGNVSKTRGTIRIYNDFGPESQSLVATTRFETQDGHIFRLLQSVVVPGVREKDGKRERGMVEALVVADQAGAEYNIGPSQFTIPGFKGGPKYDKFAAESVQAFSGGVTDGAAVQKVISSDDVNRAAQKTMEQLKTHILAELHGTLSPGEVVLDDSLQMTKLNETTTPATGSPATEFTYEGRYGIQVFILNEDEVRQRIEAERVTASGVVLVPKKYTIKYTALLPKYDNGKIDLTVESTVLFEASIDESAIKTELLGQNEDGIRAFLQSHPEIERLQVKFVPQLLITTLSKNANRVELLLREAEASPID